MHNTCVMDVAVIWDLVGCLWELTFRLDNIQTEARSLTWAMSPYAGECCWFSFSLNERKRTHHYIPLWLTGIYTWRLAIWILLTCTISSGMSKWYLWHLCSVMHMESLCVLFLPLKSCIRSLRSDDHIAFSDRPAGEVMHSAQPAESARDSLSVSARKKTGPHVKTYSDLIWPRLII